MTKFFFAARTFSLMSFDNLNQNWVSSLIPGLGHSGLGYTTGFEQYVTTSLSLQCIKSVHGNYFRRHSTEFCKSVIFISQYTDTGFLVCSIVPQKNNAGTGATILKNKDQP